MLNEPSGFSNILLSILLFPLHFQSEFLAFAWGAEDEFWIMVAKRLLVLLPAAVIILGSWLTILCSLTVIVRNNRHEYIVSLREKDGIKISDQQVLEHAGVSSMDQIHAMGYHWPGQYIKDRIIHAEREVLLVANGGLPYKDWIETEISRFLENPSLLFRQYSCIFANLFPDKVFLDTDVFLQSFSTLDVELMIELVFEKSARLDDFMEGEATIFAVSHIPLKCREYWR